MNTVTAGRMPSKVAVWCAAAAIAVLPAVVGTEVHAAQTQKATAVAAAATPPPTNPTTADTSPYCPSSYECIQPGTDPGIPYGTDPFVPYGPA